VLRGFAAAALAFFGTSTFATSSIRLRTGVVGFATSATFTFFAEAWRGVAVAFVFFTGFAMLRLLFAEFAAIEWGIILLNLA
jgi:hypothetical protein